MDENKKSKKPLVIGLIVGLAIVLVAGLTTLIAVNSKYRTLNSALGYTLRFNAERYEYKKAASNLDMIQIKDMSLADNDCYVYVGEYDPSQDLQETLDIIYQSTGEKYGINEVKFGKGAYYARQVAYTGEKGEIYNVFFVDEGEKHFVVQTCSDKKHSGEIEKMIKSFTVVD